MYITKVNRSDLARKWALPDRIFFACGACHILAHTCIRKLPDENFRAIWIKPRQGYIGNHIVAVAGDVAFDYHGFSSWSRLRGHISRKARMWWPGWDAELIELPAEVLVSGPKSRAIDGLWLRGPDEFPHDAVARAERFFERLASNRFSELYSSL